MGRGYRTLILLLLLVSCAQTGGGVNLGPSDEDLLRESKKFYLFYPHARRDVVMQWTSINYKEHLFKNELTLGACSMSPSHAPLVQIHAGRVNPIDIAKVQVVLWHELGHCALGLPHASKDFTDTNGITLMQPTFSWMFLDDPLYYLERLLEPF